MPKRQSTNQEIPKPPIEDVLRELGADDVPLGYGWRRMICPFCDDRNGSASVNHEVGGFRCHQCGRSGDGIKLLQTEAGLSFADACKRAREMNGEPGNRQAKPKRKRRASDLLKGMR